MCYLAQAKFPPTYRFDDDGKFRQFSSGSPSVMIRLIEAMNRIQGFITKESNRKTVKKHIDMVLSLGEGTITEPNDLNDLREKVD